MTDQYVSALWQRFKDMYGQKWTSLFQGDEAISSWRMTWAGLVVTGEEIKHALDLLPNEYADWPPTFGQFKALCRSHQKPYVALSAPKVIPNSARAEEFRNAVSALTKRPGNYWTPAVVANHAQVDFIVRQARHFGHTSNAYDFLLECKKVGVINAENKFVPALAARQYPHDIPLRHRNQTRPGVGGNRHSLEGGDRRIRPARECAHEM